MTSASIALLVALGASVGFLAGLLGIGGGMLMVPVLALVLDANGFPAGESLKVAIATSLATVVFTSASSLRGHHRHGSVRWPVVALLAPGIVAGSLAGSQVAAALRGPVLAVVFATFVAVSATQMLVDRKPRATRQLPGRLGMFAAGSAIGTISAIVGAGGAFVAVPFMIWCNVDTRQAVGTSAALGFPIALAGTLGYALAEPPTGLPAGSVGLVYLPALAAIAAASMVTASAGARTAHRMPVAHLKKDFAVLLYGIAASVLHRAFAA